MYGETDISTAERPRVEFTGEATLPKKLVRKVATDSVLLSDVVPIGDYEFALRADMPRVHLLLNDSVEPHYDFYDISLFVELGRQALMSAAHTHLGVPLERKLILTSFDLDADTPEPNLRQALPAPIDIHMRLKPTLDGDVIAGGECEFSFEIDGRHRALSGGSFVVRTAPEYNALRGRVRERRQLPPLPEWAGAGSLGERGTAGEGDRAGACPPPELVGRSNPVNVLIGDPRGAGPEFTAEMVVDQLHAFFFDHPDEHVPGSLMIEAMRQMAMVCASRSYDLDPACAVVTWCKARFLGFAELEFPLECSAVLEPPRRENGQLLVPARFTLRQPGAKIGKCSLTLGFFPAGDGPVRREPRSERP